MAMHFARGSITSPDSISSRLNKATLDWANLLPSYRRTRYLASRSLLAELLFMLYGIKHLPDIELSASGRPHFSDSTLPDFSIAYAGNIVGVLLAPEGQCGLEMALQQRFATSSLDKTHPTSGNEIIWANNQLDPNEARSQLYTLRQSVLKLAGIPAISLQLLPISGRLKVDNAPYIETISDVEDILVWGCAATPGIVGLQLWSHNSDHSWQKLTDIQTRYQSPGSRVIRLTSVGSEATMPYQEFSQQG